MSGIATYIKDLLEQSNPGQCNVDQLIEKLGSKMGVGQETGLLEFKGSYWPDQEGDDPDKDQPQKFVWNVLEALIAMANSRGGCVIIGLAESKDKRDIEAGCWDPRRVTRGEGLEVKDVQAKMEHDLFQGQLVFCGKASDNPKSNTVKTVVKISSEDLHRLKGLVEIVPCRSTTYACNAFAAIISPIPAGEKFIAVCKKVGEIERSITCVRKKNEAENLPLTDVAEITDFKDKRKLWIEDDAFRYARRLINNYASHIPSPPLSPDRRVSLFVGRLRELADLDHALRAHKPVLIYGEGGVGKTTLAFQYAWTHCWNGLEDCRADYAAAFYIRAEGANALAEALCRLPLQDEDAKRDFNLPNADEYKEPEWMAKAILTRLRQKVGPGKVLILLDNIDDPGILNLEYGGWQTLDLSMFDSIYLYATSRSNCLNEDCGTVLLKVENLPEEDALALLQKHRSYSGSPEEAKAAQEIVKLTEGLPWALDIIGAELRNRRYRSGRDYQLKLEKLRDDLEGALKSHRPIRHRALDTKSLLMPTFELLKNESGDGKIGPFIFDAVNVCSWFPVDEIQERFVKEAFETHIGKNLDEWDWKNDYWIPLFDFCILYKVSEGVARMHRLTREVILSLPDFDRERVWSALFKMVKGTFAAASIDPEVDGVRSVRHQVEALLFRIVHSALSNHNREILEWEIQGAGYLDCVCRYLYIPRELQEESKGYLKALLDYLSESDSTPSDEVGQSRASLLRYQSVVMHILGDYEGAVKSGEAALDCVKNCKDQSDLWKFYQSLACAGNSLGWRRGDPDIKRQGLKYADKAREIVGRQSETSLEYADCCSTLSVAYDALQEYDQALRWGNLALEIRKGRLPERHLTLARSFNNLANTYQHVGGEKERSPEERRNYLDQAIAFGEQSLAIRRSRVSIIHPGIAWNMSSLADSYLARGDFAREQGEEDVGFYRKAYDWCREAWKMRIDLFEETHPAVARSCEKMWRICDRLPASDSDVAFQRKECLACKKRILEGYDLKLCTLPDGSRTEELKRERERVIEYLKEIHG